MSFGEMNPNDPCTKDCKDRCVGCKSNCIKYLEYVVFDCKPRKKAPVKKEIVVNTSKNKRFIKMEVYDEGNKPVKRFDCISDCVRYIRDKYIIGKSEGSIRYGIYKAISNNEMYMGFYFRRIENVL